MKTHSLAKYYLCLIITVLIWGSGLLATKLAIEYGLPPGMVNMLRMGIGAAAMFVMFFPQIRRISKTDIRHGLVGGLIMGGSSALQTIGMAFSTVSTNSFICSTQVVFVPILCWIFFKRRLTKGVVIGVAGVMVGMVILTGLLKNGGTFNAGDLLTLAGSLGVAAQVTYTEHAAADANPASYTFVQLCVSTVISAVYFLAVELPFEVTENFGKAMLISVYMGVVFTALAYYLMCVALSHIESRKASLIMSLEGASGSFFSVVFGLETMTPSLVIGGSIILASVIISQLGVESQSNG